MKSRQEAGKGEPAMRECAKDEVHPQLKGMVVEASRALARLDAGRLEELALSCEALNRGLVFARPGERDALARQGKGIVGDMAVFSRVLEATRANLNVMQRLRELREGILEYRENQVSGMMGRGSEHGDN